MNKLLIGLLVVGLCLSFGLQYQPLSKNESPNARYEQQPNITYTAKNNPAPASNRDNIIFSESFTETTFPPTDWSVVQNNTGTQGGYNCYWSRFTEPGYLVHSNPAAAGLWWSYGHQDEWLITSEINLTGSLTNNYYLRYWTYGFFGSNDSDHYYTKISTDGGVTWTTLFDLSEQPVGWNRYEEPVVIDLSAYADSSVKIAWQMQDGPAGRGASYVWFVDDVAVSYPYATDMGVANLLDRKPIPMVVGETDTFFVRVCNFGTDAQNDVSVKMAANDVLVNSTTVSITGLEFTDISFTWTPAVSGDYTVKFFTELTDDEDMTNDTLVKSITICPEFHPIPYSKDFNEDWGPFGNNPPFCGWRIIDNGDEAVKKWNRNDWFKGYMTNPSREVAVVRYAPREHQDEWLISPRLNCSIDTQYTLSFWHQYEGYKNADPDTGYVLVSTDGGNIWTEITKYAGGVNGLVSYGYQMHNITSLVAGEADVRIAYRYFAYNAGRWQIDDFNMMYTPTIDAMPIAIDVPTSIILNQPFNVSVKIKNSGMTTLSPSWYVYLQMRDEKDSALVTTALDPESTLTFTFTDTIADLDTYLLTAWTAYPGDEYPTNDILTRMLRATGWVQIADVPIQAPLNKGIKDGGALTVYGDTIFAFRGGNTREFYAYDPVVNTWFVRDSIAYVIKLNGKVIPKRVKAGGSLVTFGDKIYAFKGGGVNEFWAYLPGQDTWIRKTDMPMFYYDPTKKTKVKTGAALVAYDTVIYAFKGGNTKEFWMYIPFSDTWARCCSLSTPDGKKIKAGGALVALDDMIYAFVGGNTVHFYAYSPMTNTWTQKYDAAFDPNPAKLRKIKVKDGGSLTALDGKIYGFKGGNKPNFGYYNPTEDTWYTLEGISGLKKVKHGGALVAYDGKIYAFKGGNTREFWSYTPQAETAIIPLKHSLLTDNSIMSEGKLTVSDININITPNPFNKLTTISYSVPISGMVTIKLYNAMGNLIQTLRHEYLNTGTYRMNLSTKGIANGVYFLRYEDATNQTEIKLIVQ